MLQWMASLLGIDPIILVSPLATLISATVAALIAWTALRTSAAVNLRNKRVDVISDCNKRYDALALTKTAIVTSLSAAQTVAVRNRRLKSETRRQARHEIELYHRRFWGLKSDQIDYWLAGYVDPETLISWFMSTIDAIHNPVGTWRELKETAAGGWKSVSEFHRTTNPRLYEIVEAIAHPAVKDMSQDKRYALLFDLFRSIEREEQPLIAMLTRNNHRRLSMHRFKSKLPRRIARLVLRSELNRLRASLRASD